MSSGAKHISITVEDDDSLPHKMLFSKDCVVASVVWRCENRKLGLERKTSAVYILLGRIKDDDTYTMYVGQSTDVEERLNRHYTEKDFWKLALVFYRDGSFPFTRDDLDMLEYMLYSYMRSLKNSLEYNKQPISLEQERGGFKRTSANLSDMTTVIEFAMRMFGYSTTASLEEDQTTGVEDSTLTSGLDSTSPLL